MGTGTWFWIWIRRSRLGVGARRRLGIRPILSFGALWTVRLLGPSVGLGVRRLGTGDTVLQLGLLPVLQPVLRAAGQSDDYLQLRQSTSGLDQRCRHERCRGGRWFRRTATDSSGRESGFRSRPKRLQEWEL